MQLMMIVEQYLEQNILILNHLKHIGLNVSLTKTKVFKYLFKLTKINLI